MRLSNQAHTLNLDSATSIREALVGDNETRSKFFDLTTINHTISQGIGEKSITAHLADIPGINAGTVRTQLANLKASGDYARIVKEVSDQIEAGHILESNTRS